MDRERGTISGLELARWAVVALLVLVGIGLFFTFGHRTAAVVHPAAEEAAL